MTSKRHFIILEVETKDEQPPKAVEDEVLAYIRNGHSSEVHGFTFKSVGWIADNVREAPTGKQEV